MRQVLVCAFAAFATGLAGLASSVAAHTVRIVILPDTQKFAQSEAEQINNAEPIDPIYSTITSWIEEQYTAPGSDIVFLTHVGDIINNADNDTQWGVAVDAHDLLSAVDMPWYAVAGNHDASSDPDRIGPKNDQYKKFFGPDSPYQHSDLTKGLKKDQPWFGGHSPSTMSAYQTIEAGGLKLLFLHLNIGIAASEIEFAKQVFEAHPDHLVFVITHDYIVDVRVVRGRGPAEALLGQVDYNADSGPTALYQQVLGRYPNFFALFCGHIDGEYRQLVPNGRGLLALEQLNDFQSGPDGGPWLKILTLDTTAGSLSMETYSPWFIDDSSRNGEPVRGKYRTVEDQVAELEFVLSDQLRKVVEPVYELLQIIPAEFLPIVGDALKLIPTLPVDVYELLKAGDKDTFLSELGLFLTLLGLTEDDVDSIFDTAAEFPFENVNEPFIYALPDHIANVVDDALATDGNGELTQAQLEINIQAVFDYIFNTPGLAAQMFYSDGKSAPSYTIENIDFARFTAPWCKFDVNDDGAFDVFDVLAMPEPMASKEPRVDFNNDNDWTPADIVALVQGVCGG